MSNYAELAELIGEAADAWLMDGHRIAGSSPEGEAAKAVLAAGYRRHRIITTTADVDALLDGSVAATQYGDAITIRDSVRATNPSAYHFLVSDEASDYATVLWEPQP